MKYVRYKYRGVYIALWDTYFKFYSLKEMLKNIFLRFQKFKAFILDNVLLGLLKNY